VEGDNGIVLATLETLEFQDIAYILTSTSGIGVRYAPELDGEVDVSFEDGVIYEGPLSRFLDSVASVGNVDWRYDPAANEIEFYQFVTRAFRLDAFAEASSASLGAADVEYDLWGEVVTAIEAIIGDDGEVDETGSNGNLIVTTTPRRMRHVREFIDLQNSDRLRQLVINVAVYTVTVDDSQGIGINLGDLVFSRLGSEFRFSSGSAGTIEEGISATFKVLSGDQGPAGTPGKYFQGSEAVFSALGKLGNTSVVTSASLTTLNDQPAPLNIGTTKNYVSATTTSSTDAGIVTTTSTGTVDDGIDFLVRPRILEDNRIRLTFAMEMTSATLERFDTGNGIVQLPVSSEREFYNQILLNNGDTMVLAGFEQAEQSANRSGITPALWALGGSTTAGDKRTVIVLTLQPIILEDGGAVEPAPNLFKG
jgi:type IVB pilus formation R64 PilN family outer membrane protein